VFSGIVERVGVVERAERAGAGLELAVRADFDPELKSGASVAVNGVCLTVERAHGGLFEATAVPETLARTTLAALRPGRRVNLERALRVGDELGGHWVLGHVDAVGRVQSVQRSGAEVRVAFEIPEAVRPYVAPKGSIAVDGVSLTVAVSEGSTATVALVPYTIANTIASDYVAGTLVNLEADLVARYLERLLASRETAAALRGGEGRS
jgi:riboflavin synthase alpha subunit